MARLDGSDDDLQLAGVTSPASHHRSAVALLGLLEPVDVISFDTSIDMDSIGMRSLVNG